VSTPTTERDAGRLDTGRLDTRPADQPGAAPDGTSALVVTTPHQIWRAARAPLLIGCIVLLAAIVIAIAYRAPAAGRLDPEAVGPEGSRALAQLLRDRGVDVHRTRALPPPGATGTVLVAGAQLLSEAQLTWLSSWGAGRHVVLVEPPDVTALGATVEADRAPPVRSHQPGCDLDVAETAGSARMGGTTYSVDGDAVTCYAAAGRPTLVQVRRGDTAVTLLGAGDFLTNEHLDDDGNAALAIGLLSDDPVVHWVLPSPFGPPEEADSDQAIGELLPDRIGWLTLQLLVAGVVAALWRGRRLGPVVAERLPVVVRAAEAVEGRARLYAAGQARGRAAELLRTGTRDRLVRALALAPDASPDAVIKAVSARSRRDGTAVAALLYGPAPDDDESLVRLATELDTLDSEVRHT
jgi:hypothetical protein